MKALILSTLIVLIGCGHPKSEFKTLNKKVAYKYIQFGEGESPLLGDYIAINLSITSLSGDTLHYVPDYPYYIKLQQSALDSACQIMKIGDSVVFRLPRAEVNRFYKFYQLMQSDQGEVLMHVRLNGIFDSTSMEVAKRKQLSLRELDEQKQLQVLLKKLNSRIDTLDGAFRIIEKRIDSATAIINGSQVSIHYKGQFLNGYVFDNTYDKGITPTFTFGKEYQLIEGMKLGINGLKEGERVKIIVPSRRGFGQEGSLAGIVPPYTAVIFEVEIIKVIN